MRSKPLTRAWFHLVRSRCPTFQEIGLIARPSVVVALPDGPNLIYLETKMNHKTPLIIATLFLSSLPALANVYGAVRGVVHDPQHRPIQGATVTLKAKTSDLGKTTTTDANGEFQFNAVSLGDYSLTVVSKGFAQTAQDVTVISGTVPVAHFQLQVASAHEQVTVSASSAVVPTDTATPITIVDALDIERTPGADRSNSLAMITDYVPGSYVTHDMLHIRGGHQTTWLLDGIPVINTAIAQNVGPQFDPKDLEYVEANRGSYSAEFGDRTYGVFNVVPRTGFERNNQAELVLSAGNFYQTNDALSFGSHTERFAYYASVNGNRSNLGLQTPVPQVVHDAVNGVGGFGSFIFNVDPSDQLRLMTSLRRDYFQVPYDPDPNDIENGSIAANGFSPQYPSIGLRDGEHETDAGVLFTWVHTFNSHLMTTVSPFYHYNRGDYDSQPSDTPVATTEDRGSTYVGGQASIAANYKKNDLQIGFLSFYQSDSQLFGAIFNDGSGNLPFTDSESPNANLEAFYIDDKFKPFSWLTLSAGMRPTRFSEGSRLQPPRPRHQLMSPPSAHVSGQPLPCLASIGLSVPSTDITIKPRPSKPSPVRRLSTTPVNKDLGTSPSRASAMKNINLALAFPTEARALDADNFEPTSRFSRPQQYRRVQHLFPITVSQA